MLDKIIINSKLLPENTTLGNVLNDIKEMLKSQNEFEDIVYNILTYSNMDEEDIASLFNLSRTKEIEFYINLIQTKL